MCFEHHKKIFFGEASDIHTNNDYDEKFNRNYGLLHEGLS